MSQPPRVDLPSEDHSCSFERSCKSVLVFSDSVVDADVGPTPVAFLEIGDCINIVLVDLNSQSVPHCSQCFDVVLVVPIETVLVLDLEEDDWPSIFGPVGLQDWH